MSLALASRDRENKMILVRGILPSKITNVCSKLVVLNRWIHMDNGYEHLLSR